MKITQEQRQKNIESVLKATVELSRDCGFSSLTMKAIAKKAGIGEATIYNYFPKKELLITGFLNWSLSKAIEETQKEDPGDFKFTEIVHSLIENHIEVSGFAKPFLKEVMEHLFVNPLVLANTGISESKQNHYDFLNQHMNLAIERSEFSKPPFQEFILGLIWDFHIGILFYWLREEDPKGMKTTQLVDLSMQTLQEILAGDLFGKLYKIGHFLFKEHVLYKILNSKNPAL